MLGVFDRLHGAKRLQTDKTGFDQLDYQYAWYDY